MSRLLSIFSAAVVAGALAATPSEAEAGPRVVVTVAPVIAPAPAMVWVPPQTVWDARLRRHVVISGHWRATQPAPPAEVWIPGYWTSRGRSRTWVAGHWERR